MFYYYLISPGERPKSISVARHLWGNDPTSIQMEMMMKRRLVAGRN
jgi:hypothetical protein